MNDGYQSKCPKCYTPVGEVQKVYHAYGECRTGNSGSEHVEWTCKCGYKWLSYTR